MTGRAFLALTGRELRRWIRTPTAIVASIMTPFFYLLLFGQAFNIGKFLASGPPQLALIAFQGAPNYYSYFSAGLVMFVVLFSSLFIGANVIFDKRLGYIKKLTVAPVSRAIILSANVAAGVIRCLLFGSIVLALALGFDHLPGLNGLTVTASVTPWGAVEIFLSMVFLATAFTSIFVTVGYVLEQVESYFAIVNLVNLPLLFSSTALAPETIMPGWLQTIAKANPITLSINVLRENLFPWQGYYPYPPETYLAILLVFTLAVVGLSVAATIRSLAPT
jgi:ABC-2 type transport system permease protein